jgi:serine protease Do
MRRLSSGIASVAAVLSLSLDLHGAPEEPLWTELGASPRPVAPGPAPLIRLARSAGPAVVNVSTVLPERAGARRAPVRSQGTGFLIRSDGYLLTNHHVIEGADEVRVRLADEREFSGRLIGSDARTDVALLKIDAPGELAVAPLGDSDRIDIGEWVMAIGNPFGLDHTVTVGIISGKGRRDVRPGGSNAGFYDFIQTDASINVGNSGGPLINLRGEVIGVNTAINAQGQGIAFAIPINMVKNILPALKAHGRLARSWLGATLQPLTPSLSRAFGLPDTRGALVAAVLPSSPAERSGIAAGDVIVELDGQAVRRADDLTWRLSIAGAGSRVALTIRRAAATRKVAVLLAADPEEPGEAPALVPRPAPTPLGISVADLSASPAEAGTRGPGVVVLTVEPGSPASEAGIERGDVLLQLGDRPIAGLDEYRRLVNAVPQGAFLRVLARREGRRFWAAFEKRAAAAAVR